MTMRDPFGSLQAMMNQFSGFMQNPMQYMMQKKLNLPANINPMQNPQQAVQYLMNNGTIDQQTYNQLQQMAQRIQQNPQFIKQFMGGKK